jgi:phosphatidylserine/phosphatidylglycerophosphate/cardiolipin synthase-like enzyme
MDLPTLKATYVTNDPPMVGDSKVTPLLDGWNFGDHLRVALLARGPSADPAVNRSNGEFVYIHGWWLGLVPGKLEKAYGGLGYAGFNYDPAGGNIGSFVVPNATGGYLELLPMLTDLAARGVEVRVVGWCHPSVLRSALGRWLVDQARQTNVMTIESLRPLRNDPNIGGYAILNTVHHAGGAAHAKVVIAGNNTEAVAFTGGIDLMADRVAHVQHASREIWHDVMAKVEGPGVQGIHDWFQDIWHDATTYDNKPRAQVVFRTSNGEFRSHLLGTAPVPNRSFTTPTGAKHHVQSLRTLPAANYKTLSFAPGPLPSNHPVAGEFKLADAWHKAISGATRYIYIEDQSFFSSDVLRWVHDRVIAVPDLRVVLVTGGRGDPNDPANDSHPYLCQSLNGALLGNLTPAQKDRIRMFRRWGEDVPAGTGTIVAVTAGPGATTILDCTFDTEAVNAHALVGQHYFVQQGAVQAEVVENDAAPAGKGQPLRLRVKTPAPPAAFATGPVDVRQVIGLFVHTKTTIVDDNWAIIGSANCMQRSLYTDLEHAVAFVDENGTAVRDYRAALWSHHFRDMNPANWLDIDAALHSWEPSWFAAGASPARPGRLGVPGPEWIEPLPLPLPSCSPLSSFQKHVYDVVLDVDSRQPWGFLIPPKP